MKTLEERFECLTKHQYEDCVAHGEGQYCCLDKEHKRYKDILSFIKKEISNIENN